MIHEEPHLEGHVPAVRVDGPDRVAPLRPPVHQTHQPTARQIVGHQEVRQQRHAQARARPVQQGLAARPVEDPACAGVLVGEQEAGEGGQLGGVGG